MVSVASVTSITSMADANAVSNTKKSVASVSVASVSVASMSVSPDGSSYAVVHVRPVMGSDIVWNGGDNGMSVSAVTVSAVTVATVASKESGRSRGDEAQKGEDKLRDKMKYASNYTFGAAKFYRDCGRVCCPGKFKVQI